MTNKAVNNILDILLIEDDDSDVFLFRRSLGKAAAEIHIAVAGTGEAALHMLSSYERHGCKSAPDVILLDFNLPGKNGQAVLEDIRAAPAFCRIPVIAMTGPGRDMALWQQKEVPADGYLSKPVTWEALRDILRDRDLL